MTEQEQWAEPVKTPPPTLEQRYAHGLDDNAPIDDMKFIFDAGSNKPRMIEMPDWSQSTPEVAEAPGEQSFEQKAGGATLDALGVVEPIVDDSVDDEQHFYTRAQLQAMREEARLRLEAEAPLTQESLREAMGEGPVPAREAVIPNLDQIMSGEPATPSVESVSPLVELTKGLSTDDLLELRSYAEAKIAKQKAQQDGDGQSSTLQGQYISQSYRAMSSAAKAIADRYVTLYERS